MLSKQAPAPAIDAAVTAKAPIVAEPTKVAAEPSQEFLREQLATAAPEPAGGSYLLGAATHEGSADLSAERADTFLVAGKTTSSNVGATTKSVSGMDLGSGRGDTFAVAGKTTSSNVGATTKSVSGMDLGSGRGDTFAVDGKATSSNVGATTKSVSGMDLGSGRGDTFAVDGKTTSSNVGTNTKNVSGMDLGSGREDTFVVAGKATSSNVGTNTKNVSGMDLGSGREDTFVVAGKATSSNVGTNTKNVSGMDLGSGREEPQVQAVAEAALAGEKVNIDLTKDADRTVAEVVAVAKPTAGLADIPGLTPPAGEHVAVSLPLAPAVAAAKIEQGESLSKPLEEAAVQAIEQKATLIHPADIPAGLLEVLPKDTVLRFAFSPEDMGAINLEAEHQAVAKVADVFTLNNPTEETMKHVLATGQFQDLIWSGHGSDEGVWITDLDGKAKLLPAADVATMLKGTGVQDVLLNVCEGGVAVDQALGEAGIRSFSYDRTIIDQEAVDKAVQFAESGSVFGIDANVNDSADGGVTTVMGAKVQAKFTAASQKAAAAGDAQGAARLLELGRAANQKISSAIDNKVSNQVAPGSAGGLGSMSSLLAGFKKPASTAPKAAPAPTATAKAAAPTATAAKAPIPAPAAATAAKAPSQAPVAANPKSLLRQISALLKGGGATWRR
jgi:hypothetical protein